jgi:ribosomal protein S18 acetylase RimI-like enzyme
MNILKINCIKTTKIKNPDILANVIYNNFKYLYNYPELQHTVKDIIKVLQSDGNFCYLLYNDKELIGYLVGDFRVLPDNRYGYYISYVFISEKYRNKKLGSKLMNMLINECKNRGVNHIVLTCDSRDKQIISFYKKYGFKMDPNLGGNNNKIHNVYSLRLD